jgi:SAM-dependent methyltransferase
VIDGSSVAAATHARVAPQLRDAYSAAGEGWSEGPTVLYGRLARAMVDASPSPLDGLTVVDVGAGTGAVSAALREVGAEPVQVDMALGMLRVGRHHALGATVGDVTALPLRARGLGASVAGFCLNHLADPAAGLREMARVVVDGGPVLASTFGRQEPHPAKAVVDEVAAAHGFETPTWYVEMKREIEPRLGTVEAMRLVALTAGLDVVAVTEDEVDAGIDEPTAMVEYRLGMAHLAGFVATLDPGERAAVAAEAADRLAGAPPVRPRVIVVAARAT